MEELRFQDPNPTVTRKRAPHGSSRGSRGRDMSPNSVIFTPDSNLSVFSSASASAGRCSFASDAHDGDCLSSEVFSGLAGPGIERESFSGPDPHHIRSSDSNKSVVLCSGSNLGGKVEKAKVHTEKDNKILPHLVDNETQYTDSERNSFSQALKECQERRSKYEVLNRKLERQRPASLDLNNSAASVISSSPQVSVMSKEKENETGTITSRKSGNFLSPGTPSYRQCSVGVNKGWCSERVPLPGNGNRKQVSGAVHPFINGRPLPSKWEDAERWIFSPVAGDGYGRPSYQQQQSQRRPKSKSGPLGAPGVAYYSLYSPAVHMHDRGYFNSHLIATSPFSAGVMAADRLSIHAGGDSGGFSNKNDHCIARSASVHGCTDLICQSSYSSSKELNLIVLAGPTGLLTDGVDVKDAASNITRVISRRDMATQMSPEGSFHSSPRRSSFSPSRHSGLPIVEVQSYGSSKSEVRDVQVDERVTVTRWSKKHASRVLGVGLDGVDDWKLKNVSSSWDVSDNVKGISKAKREEARITAWENLQKAKAEAAIRKLEMKLEKKRSLSMDKIMNKLKSAQKKAQKMRNAVSANQTHQGPKTSSSKELFFRRTRHMPSLSGCFMCHAQ